MKRMLINATDPEEARIAVVENGVLLELHVEIAGREAYLGNIYKGRVVNIEPSIGAAFVAFGGRTNGFLHASDVLPAYARPDFQLEDVVEGRARVSGDEGPDSVRAILDDTDDDDDDDEVESGGDAKKPRRGRRSGKSRVKSGEAEASDESGADDGDDDAPSGSSADDDEDGGSDDDRDADGVVEASVGVGHDEFGLGAADEDDDDDDDHHAESGDSEGDDAGEDSDGEEAADEQHGSEDAELGEGDDAAEEASRGDAGADSAEARRRSRRRR
ncbi:MAG: hypothetical protein O2865_09340, partial [Planctomycetota bacterium]|nr:hypothetical protein [Planctomycetota bacterium]